MKEVDELKERLLKLDNNVTRDKIISAGITKTLLQKIYLDPEVVKTRFGDTYYIYDISKLIPLLDSEFFHTEYEKSLKRKVKMLESCEKRRQQNISLVENIEIEIRKISLKQLKRLAIESWQNWNEDVWDDSSEEHTKRIMRNYVRHNLVDYDSVLEFFPGRLGRQEMYFTYRTKIDEEIERIYPELI